MDKGKDGAIRIKSIQANSLYTFNNYIEDGNETDSKKPYLDLGEAVITECLFAEYMKHHGVVVNKKGRSKDFIVMKFDYGVKNGMSAKELRAYYYENGATVTWITHDKEGNEIKAVNIHYKMLYRSAGMAKDGDCIFIREKFHRVALKYLTMNLWDKMPTDHAKIVEMSAYAPLTTATTIDYITIPMENILIVKDEDVTTMINAVSVKTHNGTSGRKECFVDRTAGKTEVKNTLWDGMGIIDEEIFPPNRGMVGFIYCRSHFFKSCLFRGNIQDYFKDYYGENYNTAMVKDMFGNSIKISDVKVIITENSIKWIKFADLMGGNASSAYKYYRRFMKKHGDRFAIVKTAHGSKYGDLQRSSYQINNSFPCFDTEILYRIAKTSIDYCNQLKTDYDAYRKHLFINKSKRYSINNVLLALDQWNENFKYTKYFKVKKNEIISKFKNEQLKLGKLLQYGDNLTICGNVIALLMKVTGQDFLAEPCFKQIDNGIQCYTTRFHDGERLAGFRSPHNAPNNIVHLVNTYSESLQRYFPKLGDNVIVINGIRTDVQFRLNGQDLDTDAIYATNQPDIVDIAEYAYCRYPTIINDIGLKGNSEYKKDMKSYAEMDSKISSLQYAIGKASNIAQLALSYYYDSGSDNQELEDIFIICSVLAQVAIDSAKRIFDINVNSELTRLSNLPCMLSEDGKKYPVFYARVQERKNAGKKKKKEIKKSEIKEFNCPMEILAGIIEENIIDIRKNKKYILPTYNLNTVFQYEPDNKRDSKQYKKVISVVQKYDLEVKKLDRSKSSFGGKIKNLFEDCIMELENIYINRHTMSALIAYAFISNGDIRDKLLTVLYDKDSKKFLKCFKKSPKSPAKSPETPANKGV